MFKTRPVITSICICVCIFLALTIINFIQHEKSLDVLEMNPLPQTGSQGFFNELQIHTDLPQAPTEMKVFKIKNLNLSKSFMNEIVRRLELKGQIKENNREYAIADETESFTLDKSTGSYNYYTKKLADAIIPINILLSEQEYMTIAEKFLKEKGLMRDEAYFNKILKHTVGKADESEKVCLIEAVFTKKLNGIKFTGVGPRISVFFGENGEIIGAFSVWKEVEEYGSYPIININQAVENIVDKKAVIANAVQNDIGQIEEAELIYDMESVRSNQKYVIPYYLVSGKCQNDKTFTALTRAIPEEFIAEIKLDEVTNTIRNNYISNTKEVDIPKRQDQ